MSYVRKTIDEWHTLIDYGAGWEHECTDVSRRDALECAETYRLNAPMYPVKIRKVRVRLDSLYRYRNMAKAFDVYLFRRDPVTLAGSNDLIDTVFYNEGDPITCEEVRRSLIEHDGYHPAIVVKHTPRGRPNKGTNR